MTTGNEHAVHLRVLIANERLERLERLAPVVAGLGHEVIAQEISAAEVGAVTARERPDGGHKVADVAQAIVESHQLLVPPSA